MGKAAALAIVFLAWPARAQEPPVPDWARIEAVEVKAQPGPAVWRLTRGNSEVWLLGTVGVMPKDLDWNKQYLSDLLDGARAILMPPKADIGLVDIAWFLLMHGGELSLPHGQKLEDGLPEALRARFVTARSAVSDDAGDYATDIPIRAAIRLQQDMMRRNSWTGREPNETIAGLARRKRIADDPVTRFGAMDAVRDILRLSPEQQRACLSEAVDDVNWSLAHAERAARAWAVGDIKGVKANYSESRLGDCVMAAVHAFADIEARSIADTSAAIDAALNRPGKTIVVVGMRPLLKRGGVLERLQAMHVAIEAPAE
ncbi:MAG TPA: TraB/GumN family protein [Rhizomicrobium sp.]